jgi:hypothetical protein
MEKIDYKYNEGELIKEFQEYIDSTYGQHYSMNKFQATEFIVDNGHGVGFTAGNVMKYVQRYGKKNGRDRQDLLKVLHYALMLLYVHDIETSVKDEPETVRKIQKLV